MNIFEAAYLGYVHRVKELVTLGIDMNQKDQTLKTPLMYAAERGHLKVVEVLLEQGGNVHIKDITYMTALMYAAVYNHPKVVEVLLKGGADVNAVAVDEAVQVYCDIPEARYRFNGSTALIWATQVGQTALTEVVRGLLHWKADVNVKDKLGNTALMYAALYGHCEIVGLLLNNGAIVDTKNNYDKSALSFATEEGHKEIVQLLKETKPSLN